MHQWQDELDYQRTQIERLEAEVKRLKAGNFTPEEFQVLCHNLHERGTPCTRAEFDHGCKKFQDLLFGPEDVSTRARNLLDEKLKEAAETKATMMEAYCRGFLEVHGLAPDQVVMVEEMKDNKIQWYLKKKE
jgi:hypothetical protein